MNNKGQGLPTDLIVVGIVILVTAVVGLGVIDAIATDAVVFNTATNVYNHIYI